MKERAMPIREPEEFHQRFAEAVNSGDLNALSDFYESQARIVPQWSGPPVLGAAAIREHFQSLLALKGRIQVETTTVSKAGDLALLRSKWSVTGVGPAGEPTEMSGESVEVLRRQPDGSWRAVIDLPFGSE
jgi:ketosteroid isomerase-like protein